MSQAFRLIARLPYCVPGTWHLGPGTRIDTEGRIPSTEDRARVPGKRVHRACPTAVSPSLLSPHKISRRPGPSCPC